MQPPLAGIRVLDASRVLAGPFAGQLLADLGAEVVKLERPGSGDDTRGWGPPFLGPFSAYFLSCNRGKKSVALDLGTPAGRAVFEKLLANTDVLIENFRTDTAEEFGLLSPVLLQRHPHLVACSISGFGRTGPRRDEPGYDFAIQALCGLMAITGPAGGPPSKVGVAVADVLTGLYAAAAVCAALRARERTGHGYAIDLALHDCALAAQVNVAQAYLTSGSVPARQGNAHLQIVPYELFPTADGHLVLAVGNDSQWRAFCKAAGAEPDAAWGTNRRRVELRAAVVPWVAAIMLRRNTADWETELAAAGVPHAAVRDFAAAFDDPQTLHRGMRISATGPDGQPAELLGSPVHMPGVACEPDRFPPALGADTAEILSQWAGVSDADIAAVSSSRPTPSGP
jgi:crotonobetainyl-CoA:carnitine CoA-transferase CaiB-like acyl-CoA transferase